MEREHGDEQTFTEADSERPRHQPDCLVLPESMTSAFGGAIYTTEIWGLITILLIGGSANNQGKMRPQLTVSLGVHKAGEGG